MDINNIKRQIEEELEPKHRSLIIERDYIEEMIKITKSDIKISCTKADIFKLINDDLAANFICELNNEQINKYNKIMEKRHNQIDKEIGNLFSELTSLCNKKYKIDSTWEDIKKDYVYETIKRIGDF